MASLRRALSPVLRSGTLLNGEARQVASPLSKSSSNSQNYPLLLSSMGYVDYAMYKAHYFVLGLFSPQSSRPLDRSKLKGQFWRRAFFHFFICFVVGIIVGLTPFISLNLSINVMSKHQAVFIGVLQPVTNSQGYAGHKNETSGVVDDRLYINENSTLEPQVVNVEPIDGFFYDTSGHHKLLIIVTPTYARPLQAYYMSRLANTLKLIKHPSLWIVVEMKSQSAEIADLLRKTGVMYRHLVSDNNSIDKIERAVHLRNVALSHIETHRLNGIVYFADDDNIYSIDLFNQMRQIRQSAFGTEFTGGALSMVLLVAEVVDILSKDLFMHVCFIIKHSGIGSSCKRLSMKIGFIEKEKFGTWVVAKLAEVGRHASFEGPICNGSQVRGWHMNDMTKRFRRFHAEMSGFAFNSTIIWDPKRWHRPTFEPIRHLDTVEEGFQASTFIEQIVEDESQMECFPSDSKNIMVWHRNVDLYIRPQIRVVENGLSVVVTLA
ncbi:unnamed protein product [Fraxinus pennsylvanica]|uniref:Glycosyltransferases n=1 Tax=Fraxinus pennsylvanica TaxID=56036 RepID=A0AAD2ABT7_9LAMI|nr:unnamed protein product [Fraxinus pennsylvanica]